MKNKLPISLEEIALELKSRTAEPRDVALIRQAAKRLRELEQYEENDQKLRAVYGDCDGLIDVVVNRIVEFEKEVDGKPDLLPAVKARLLTDEHVDMWEQYKKLGTPEEIAEKLKAAEQMMKKE